MRGVQTLPQGCSLLVRGVQIMQTIMPYDDGAGFAAWKTASWCMARSHLCIVDVRIILWYSRNRSITKEFRHRVLPVDSDFILRDVLICVPQKKGSHLTPYHKIPPIIILKANGFSAKRKGQPFLSKQLSLFASGHRYSYNSAFLTSKRGGGCKVGAN